MARIVRGQTLVLKGREFIEAARASGVSSWRIILRHIVPNLLGIVAIYATLLIPEMTLPESFISFPGAGGAGAANLAGRVDFRRCQDHPLWHAVAVGLSDGVFLS